MALPCRGRPFRVDETGRWCRSGHTHDSYGDEEATIKAFCEAEKLEALKHRDSSAEMIETLQCKHRMTSIRRFVTMTSARR